MYDMIQERGKLIEEGRKMSQDIEDLERRRATIGMKVEKVKVKMTPLVDKLFRQDLTEFEDLQTITVEDGKIVAEVFDWIEEYKKAFRERKTEAPK